MKRNGMRIYFRETVAGLGLLIAITQFSCSHNTNKNIATEVEDTVIFKEPILKYGLPLDSFNVEYDRVKNNQYLSQILNEKGVDMGTIDQIAKNRDRFLMSEK